MKNAPEQVRTETGFLSDIVKISASNYSSYAIDKNGIGYVFGRNDNGQLGVGDNTNKLFATPIRNADDTDNLSNIVEIQGGLSHTVILTKNKEVYTTGLNDFGQLGNGTNTSSNLPVKLTGALLSNIVSVNAGRNYTVAMRQDGYIVGFGQSNYAQLGRSAQGNSSIPIYCGVALTISPRKSIVSLNEAVPFTGQYDSFFNVYPEVPIPTVNAFWSVTNTDVSTINSSSGLFTANAVRSNESGSYRFNIQHNIYNGY